MDRRDFILSGSAALGALPLAAQAQARPKDLLVVANDPWQKTGTRPISPAADRLAMVEAAVGGVEGLEASVGVVALTPLDFDTAGPAVIAAAAAVARALG